MLLVRQVLDREIVDRDGLKSGKVDDIVLRLSENGPPVVDAIRCHNGALADQLGPRAGGLEAWFQRRVLGYPTKRNPIDVPWFRVTKIDVVVRLDVDRLDGGFTEAGLAIWNRWLAHIPLARRGDGG